MSKINYLTTTYHTTLTSKHVGALMTKILTSEFGGHVTKAADTNFNYVRTGLGSPTHSDLGGICLTIWKDAEHRVGNAKIFIFSDNVGVDAFKAYHFFEDSIQRNFLA